MAELYRKSVEEFRVSTKNPIYIILENIRSMYNVGSIFRTGDAFLIQSIYLCGFTPIPPHRDIQKTALGATETVDWKYFKTTQEAISDLQKQNITCYAVEQTKNSILLPQFIWDHNPIGLIFGNEVDGVSQTTIDSCQGVIEIPQHGMKHSLNISISTSIVLWDILNKSF